jgi:FAD/FMN-containing dehydrogenase
MEWRSQLLEKFGTEQCLLDDAERAFYSQDVFAHGHLAGAVLRPQSIADLQAHVQTLYPAGVAIHARGGGLSYTDGYLPGGEPAVVLDLQRLDKIEHIDAQDRYVVVQAGVTWHALHQALQGTGMRTPFWGPLSGLHATVGGAASQLSTFLGSARFGSIVDSVLGLEVVCHDGQMLHTGSWAMPNSAPFMREAGPDLTGLFLGDAGALGVKARIALKLVRSLSELGTLSFECATADDYLASQSAVMRAGVCSECFGFDPVLADVRMQRAALASDVSALSQVVKKQGLWEGVKLAASGRNFLSKGSYSLHCTVEADSKTELVDKLAKVRAAVGVRMKEVENSIPKVLVSMPFTPPNSILGPLGERWVPVHGIVPHSRANAAFAALQTFFAQHAQAMTSDRVRVGYLFTAVGERGFLIEPVFYWPDAQQAFHQRVVEAAHLKRVQNFPEDLRVRDFVAMLKRGAADVLANAGAVHFQLGKFYNYRAVRDATSLALFDAIKAHLDPAGLFNPGALR